MSGLRRAAEEMEEKQCNHDDHDESENVLQEINKIRHTLTIAYKQKDPRRGLFVSSISYLTSDYVIAITRERKLERSGSCC